MRGVSIDTGVQQRLTRLVATAAASGQCQVGLLLVRMVSEITTDEVKAGASGGTTLCLPAACTHSGN